MEKFSLKRFFFHTHLGMIIILAGLGCAGYFGYQGVFNVHQGDEEQLRANADSFANKYYNWRFQEALKYCTPESRQWLSWAATNVHQADLDILTNMAEGASHEIDHISYYDDTTAMVKMTIHNYLRMDTIGKEGRIIDRAVFKIPMVLRHNHWLVKMANLPRSEKQSRD